MGNESAFALFSSASNRVFPLRPQELHQHTAVMSELHPLAAVQSEPAHQVWTGVSSPRPGRRLRPASAPAAAAAAAGRGPLSGRQPEQLRQLVWGQRPRLPLAHGTAETLSGRAAEPVCQAHASVRGLGLVIADAFLCKDFTLVLLFVSAECECYIKYYNLYIYMINGAGVVVCLWFGVGGMGHASLVPRVGKTTKDKKNYTGLKREVWYSCLVKLRFSFSNILCIIKLLIEALTCLRARTSNIPVQTGPLRSPSMLTCKCMLSQTLLCCRFNVFM